MDGPHTEHSNISCFPKSPTITLTLRLAIFVSNAQKRYLTFVPNSLEASNTLVPHSVMQITLANYWTTDLWREVSIFFMLHVKIGCIEVPY